MTKLQSTEAKEFLVDYFFSSYQFRTEHLIKIIQYTTIAQRGHRKRERKKELKVNIKTSQ